MNKIEFLSCTQTVAINRNEVTTYFYPAIRIDGMIFRPDVSERKLKTEEEVDAKIESLKSFLKPKPKTKKVTND